MTWLFMFFLSQIASGRTNFVFDYLAAGHPAIQLLLDAGAGSTPKI